MHGCTCKTTYGSKRVCKTGPVQRRRSCGRNSRNALRIELANPIIPASGTFGYG
ncbi:MAG: hypothetical protein ACLTG4_08630 [Oscillospiraceae bacterium]